MVQSRIQFFAGSAAVPAGKGAGELEFSATLTKDAPLAHTLPGLVAGCEWRALLSNFWATSKPFLVKGSYYRTAEHAFQASKIALVDAATAASFAVDVHGHGSRLATGDGLAAYKARKVVLLSSAALQAWDAQKESVLEGILQAKFTSDRQASAVLLATGRAQLWHAPPSKQGERWLHLERVRTSLALREVKDW